MPEEKNKGRKNVQFFLHEIKLIKGHKMRSVKQEEEEEEEDEEEEK